MSVDVVPTIDDFTLARHDSMLDGARFILDAPTTVPAVWGEGSRVLMASGEPLVIVGPSGVGKTTVTQQLALARVGLGGSLLGFPVEPTRRRVLYLACDRPPQIARSFRRMVRDADRELLHDRLVIWKGPPPLDLARHPSVLTELAQSAGADTVIVDSLKDVALRLSDDEVGAGLNMAMQRACVAGIEVAALHHLVKKGHNGAPPTTLADVYGSGWITAGAGSVLLLWGQAGDPVVELTHLKQPAETVGPMRLLHDHRRGTTSVQSECDVLALVRASVQGVTVHEVARAAFGSTTPTPSHVEKARRRLDNLAASGHVDKLDPALGGVGGSRPAIYVASVSAAAS